MAERFNAAVLKTAGRKTAREFESHSFRSKALYAYHTLRWFISSAGRVDGLVMQWVALYGCLAQSVEQ